jgi:hypothetical protein
MACEDCGEEVKRRTRCKLCGLLICAWCRHHVHGLCRPVNAAVTGEREAEAVGTVERG